MVMLLSDYIEERKAFSEDVNAAAIALYETMKKDSTEKFFRIRIFKNFWYPTPYDMSAIIEITFKISESCPYNLEPSILNMCHMIAERKQKAEISHNVDNGILLYEFKFKCKVEDYCNNL